MIKSSPRLLHAMAVGAAFEGAPAEIGGPAADCIKRKVLDFLGPIPTGIKVVNIYSVGHIISKASVMRVVNEVDGVVEMECNLHCGDSVNALALNPVGTKVATVTQRDPSIVGKKGVLRVVDVETGVIDHQLESTVEWFRHD